MLKINRVLVVDDDQELAEHLAALLKDAGFSATVRHRAREVETMALHEFDALILDWVMPEMTGIELLQKLKSHPEFSNLPVIMLTSKGRRADIIEGLQAGAYYYIVKPFDIDLVLSVLNTAINSYYQYRVLQRQLVSQALPLQNLDSASFRLQSLAEGEQVRKFLAGFCPSPEKVSLGLNELINNAIEHGNLEFSYDDKSRLLESNTFFEEVKKRLEQPAYAGRWVTVECLKNDGELTFTISDEGSGFDFSAYLNRLADVTELHGRGILISQEACFDRVEYLGCGNKVKATVKL